MTAFILKKDYKHLLDMDYDAHHVAFKESNLFGARITDTRKIDLPKKIYCQANFNIIPEYDFPIVDVADSVFSEKMFNIFLNIGELNYREVPVTMFDDTYLDEPFDSKGILKEDVRKIESYKVIQLMEYSNVFDYKNSKYKTSKVFRDMIRNITKLVLREPKNGFPSLFRIKENSSLLFVNSETKNMIEEMGIKGCLFEPVHNIT